MLVICSASVVAAAQKLLEVGGVEGSPNALSWGGCVQGILVDAEQHWGSVEDFELEKQVACLLALQRGCVLVMHLSAETQTSRGTRNALS